jgi:putative sugar O-methyltransferase
MESIYTHIDICRQSLVDENIYNNFKNIPEYTKILQHCPQSIANKALPFIINEKVNIPWDIIQKNDQIGNPKVFEFVINDKILLLSSTTILYVYQALDILLIHKNKSLSIVEIGGGYGGLCFILFVLAPLFNVVIKDYTIIDIPDVLLHQEKYLNDINIISNKKIYFKSCFEISSSEKSYDLCISIYALGEFTRTSIDNYYFNLVSKCLSVYLWWNLSEIPQYFHENNYNHIKTGLNIDGMDLIIST